MFALPMGQIALLVLAALIFFGVLERVLDRMRMTDKTAIAIIIAMLIAGYLPAIILGPMGINIGGALIPVAVCIYLLVTANETKEKLRAIIASIAAAAAIIFFDKVLPLEPGAYVYDLDPLFIPAVIAGAIAYGLGRSRRASFIAGVLGVVLSDIAAVTENVLRGATGVGVEIGGAGMFDAVVIAGVLAVVLAEVTGEIAEFFSRRMNRKRPELLQRLFGRREFTSAIGGAKSRGRFSILIAVFTIMLALALILGGQSIVGLIGSIDELKPGEYYALVDQEGNIITKTGRRVHIGDQYITSGNQLYIVEEVENLIAKVQLVEDKIDLLAHKNQANEEAELDTKLSQAQTPLINRIFRFGQRATDPTDPTEPTEPLETDEEDQQLPLLGQTVAIYHTHNAESYVMSDGTDSIYGKGGIHQVGYSFKNALQQQGIDVIYSENLHLPHDRGAYRRSRRTFTRLMEHDPVLLFDVHRDATPPEAYAQQIEDTWVTQVQLVVGRQNQNRNANLDFAKELKALADDEMPGLVKGIFMASGNYNQDLFTRAILLEVGSHTNARESAERGIQLFAEVIRKYLENNND
ncbi:MAG: stage II sporulation protein P [Bacillota bacterium]|nr:stage II sporulation protein P [Bacillota bacterium]